MIGDYYYKNKLKRKKDAEIMNSKLSAQKDDDGWI